MYVNKYKEIHIQYEISLLLSQCNDINECSTRLLKNICKLDIIDSGGIYIVNEDDSLSLLTHTGLSEDHVKNIIFFKSDSKNAILVKKGKPIYNHHIKNHIDKIKSEFILPILYNSKPISCLNLATHTQNEIPINIREALETISLNLGGSITRIQSNQSLKDSQNNFLSLFNTIEDLLIPEFPE
jgi:putative methionine-R-sulfoxide reductase with GAF domain